MQLIYNLAFRGAREKNTNVVKLNNSILSPAYRCYTDKNEYNHPVSGVGLSSTHFPYHPGMKD